MKIFVLLAMTALCSISSLAVAQEADATAQDSRCWLASKSYSAGIVIMGGDGALMCSRDGTWEATDRAATGCIINSDFFGIGASMQRFSGSPADECSEQGTWRVRSPSD